MDVKLVKSNNVPVRDFGKGLTLRILFDKIEGAKNFDLGTVSIPPKSATAMHVRSFEEVIYMLSGTGELQMEDGTSYVLEAGDCVLIPPGLEHRHANETDEPLTQLYIFAPQGEQAIQDSLRSLPIID